MHREENSPVYLRKAFGFVSTDLHKSAVHRGDCIMQRIATMHSVPLTLASLHNRLANIALETLSNSLLVNDSLFGRPIRFSVIRVLRFII